MSREHSSEKHTRFWCVAGQEIIHPPQYNHFYAFLKAGSAFYVWITGSMATASYCTRTWRLATLNSLICHTFFSRCTSQNLSFVIHSPQDVWHLTLRFFIHSFQDMFHLTLGVLHSLQDLFHLILEFVIHPLCHTFEPGPASFNSRICHTCCTLGFARLALCNYWIWHT